MDRSVFVARDYFKKDYPAWTAVGMLGSYISELLVSVRAIAHLGKDTKTCYTPDTLKWWRVGDKRVDYKSFALLPAAHLCDHLNQGVVLSIMDVAFSIFADGSKNLGIGPTL